MKHYRVPALLEIWFTSIMDTEEPPSFSSSVCVCVCLCVCGYTLEDHRPVDRHSVQPWQKTHCGFGCGEERTHRHTDTHKRHTYRAVKHSGVDEIGAGLLLQSRQTPCFHMFVKAFHCMLCPPNRDTIYIVYGQNWQHQTRTSACVLRHKHTHSHTITNTHTHTHTVPQHISVFRVL